MGGVGGKAMRALIYSRVSTTKDEQLQALESALTRLKTYVVDVRGWTVVNVLSDRVTGSGKVPRPGWIEVRSMVAAGSVDVVVGTRIDRFARSVKELVSFADEARERGVALVFTDQSIDTTSPAGRFLFQVLAAIAELEREQIVERVRNGLNSARSRGKKLGRPAGRCDMDLARQLRAEGMSLRAIRARLVRAEAAVEGKSSVPSLGWLSQQLKKSAR